MCSSAFVVELSVGCVPVVILVYNKSLSIVNEMTWCVNSIVFSTFETAAQKELTVNCDESNVNQQHPHQTVQLGHRTLAAGLADVPDFDTAFTTSVDVACGVANSDSAHHLAVV